MAALGKRKAATPADVADEARAVCQTHCTHIGSRPTQEDRLTIVDDGWSVDPDGTPSDSADWPRCRFYAVFDGHLGDSAADAASTLLWSHLQPSLIALQRRLPSGDASAGGGGDSDQAGVPAEADVAGARSGGATA